MDHMIHWCNQVPIIAFSNQTVADFVFYLQRSINQIQIITDVLIEKDHSRIYLGSFEGLLNVMVKVFPKSPGYSDYYKNLWLTNNCHNIVRFYGADFDEEECKFAFEPCENTLEHVKRFESTGLMNSMWSKILRYFTMYIK